MRKILFILAILAVLLAVDAREPKVGDLVSVISGNTEYEGKITGLSNGIMCIAARITEGDKGWICRDYCFGTGQITQLHWINQTGTIEK